MLTTLGFVIFFVVAGRLIVPLPLRKSVKCLLALVVLPFSQYYYICRTFLGSSVSPEMPYPLHVFFGFGFILVALLCVLLLLRDIFLLLRGLARKAGFGKARPFSPARRAFAAAGLGVALGGYGFHSAVKAPGIADVEVVLNNLPPALDKLVIAHISDLHVCGMLPRERVEAVVDAVRDMDPDILFCTGDLIDGSTFKRANDVAPLRRLRARYGIFCCEGNHEYYSGYAAWMRVFSDMGLKHLHNEHALISLLGTKLVVAGLDDSAGVRYGKTGPDIKKALANAPHGPVILLAHKPELARKNAQYPVDLQLSGHTHGGQIWGFDQIVASRNNGFLRGLYQVDKMRLYVNSGAGLWTGFPVRLGVPSEIARIVLRSGRRYKER
ncbi:metallophosphoesterase [Deltaproteobacteria bacterium]|nr:metallophosphoesterase [Deltaproteobacteria bacterium]